MYIVLGLKKGKCILSIRFCASNATKPREDQATLAPARTGLFSEQKLQIGFGPGDLEWLRLQKMALVELLVPVRYLGNIQDIMGYQSGYNRYRMASGQTMNVPKWKTGDIWQVW